MNRKPILQVTKNGFTLSLYDDETLTVHSDTSSFKTSYGLWMWNVEKQRVRMRFQDDTWHDGNDLLTEAYKQVILKEITV